MITPSISVQPVLVEHAGALVELLADRWQEQPYSVLVDRAVVMGEILSDTPASIYPVRWQKQRRLGAWRAGQLIGFIHMAIGFDSESTTRPDYSPLGLIRFMLLPARPELIAPVVKVLMAAAQRYWQEAGVAEVKAFHPSTGYRSFQAGMGTLPAEWGTVVAALTDDGYRLSKRYYIFARRLTEPVEEVTPLADLSLVYRGDWLIRQYEVYYRRVDRVASAHIARMTLQDEDGEFALLKIVDLFVNPDWRRQDIAKWLLRRIINDGTHLGDVQIVVNIAQFQHPAMNLLIQQGFQELSYRGYTLEKALTQ